MIKLSIVVPVLNEADTIDEIVEWIQKISIPEVESQVPRLRCAAELNCGQEYSGQTTR